MVERSDTTGYGVSNEQHPERVPANSPAVYLLIRSAIFRICWHPYQGARGFGFGFRWYRCAQPPAKGWHPFGMRQQHKKSKGAGLFLHTTIRSTSGSERYVGKSEHCAGWVSFFYFLLMMWVCLKTEKLRWGSPTATTPFEPLDFAPKGEYYRRSRIRL